MTFNQRSLLTGVVGLSLLAAGFAGEAQEDSKTGSKVDDPISMDLATLLNTNVITASRFPEKLSEAPGAISVVSKDELKRFGGFTLREILERVAGLTASSAAITDHSIVAIRGDQTRVTGGHVLILINGRPTREILEGGIGSDILESFPVNILDRVEVIKGPGSVLYGSDAYSGVINLITQKAGSNSVHVSASGSGGGAQADSAEFLYRRGELHVVGAGQFQRSAQWNTSYRTPGGGFSGQPPGTLATQDVSLRNQGAGGFLALNYKGLSFMSSYTAWQSNSFVIGSVSEPRWRRGFSDLGYSLRARKNWDMNFNLTYTRNTLSIPAFPNIGRDSSEAVLEWSNLVTFSHRDRMTFGTLYNHVQGTETFDIVSPSLVTSDSSRSGGALYAQHEHRLRDDLKLIAGFQAIKIGNIALNVVPRAGILWNLTAHLTVKALYGQAFRAPSLNEVGLNNPRLVGNPNLVPEKVGTFDVGVSYQGNHLQAGVNYFHSRQTHLIVQDNSVTPVRFVSLGEATFYGVESEIKYYVSPNWFLMGSTLNQFHTHGIEHTPLTPIPNLGAKAGISYSAENGLVASVFDIYAGRTEGYSAALNPQPEAHHLLNSHVRFDLSKHWLKDNKTGVALFLHGDNLTNKPVWLPAWGGEPGDTMPVRQGRSVLFGLEVWLKHD